MEMNHTKETNACTSFAASSVLANCYHCVSDKAAHALKTNLAVLSVAEAHTYRLVEEEDVRLAEISTIPKIDLD